MCSKLIKNYVTTQQFPANQDAISVGASVPWEVGSVRKTEITEIDVDGLDQYLRQFALNIETVSSFIFLFLNQSELFVITTKLKVVGNFINEVVHLLREWEWLPPKLSTVLKV